MSGIDDENPFGDPVIQSAVTTNANNPTLDDYNPFDNKTAPKAVDPSPAVMNPTEEPVPTPKPQISTAEFQKRQEELEKRARELDRREEELRNAPNNSNVRMNNWPPLPKFCPIQPCFYQDINVDIPVEFQKTVKYLYYLWIGHVTLLLSNFIIGFLYLCLGDARETVTESGGTMALALVYLFLFTPAAFVCWYRPAYKAFRDDSSMNFMIFFFVFFGQFLVSVLYALGIGSMGSAGIITGLEQFGGSGGQIVVGVLMLLNGIGFGVAAAADFYLLVKIHKMYRSTGASLSKAQSEFATGVMKNDAVRQAAADAAREGVRSQFANAGGQAENRY